MEAAGPWHVFVEYVRDPRIGNHAGKSLNWNSVIFYFRHCAKYWEIERARFASCL